MPRPAPADYIRREELEKKNQDEWIDFMNSFDWSHELTNEGELYGIKNALGEVLLPPRFENFAMLTGQELNLGDRVVTKLGGKWGVIIADGKGKWLVEPQFDYIGYPNDLTHVKRDGKWGVMNLATGDYLIAPECEAVFDNSGFLFCNRIGFYKKDGLYGVLADWGAMTEPLFEDVDMEPDGYVRVKFHGEWGFIGEDNKFTSDENEAYYAFNVD